MDKEKKNPRQSGLHSDQPMHGSETDELYRRLEPEMRHPAPSPDAIAAALEAAQRLAAEADAEQAASDAAQEVTGGSATVVCRACGYRNRESNKFCGMCGVPVGAERETAAGFPGERERTLAISPNPFADRAPEPAPEARPSSNRSGVQETHYYHHHYHHHYFPGAPEGMVPRSAADPVREDKLRSTAALRGDMSRAEAAVRRITQEWVLACNTKHLDDLLDLYAADALVLRSNYPPVRGAAAIREFFFGALDAGLGEVEVDPLRVEVAGDLAYEAGRCKALVPGATGKRREERGKYLWVCSRQANGEWKLAADCWSSDLSFTMMESDIPSGITVKTNQTRKTS